MSQLQNGARKHRRLAGTLAAVAMAAFVGTSVSACNGTVDGHAVRSNADSADTVREVVADLVPGVSPCGQDLDGVKCWGDRLQASLSHMGGAPEDRQANRQAVWDVICDASKYLTGGTTPLPELAANEARGDHSADEWSTFLVFAQGRAMAWDDGANAPLVGFDFWDKDMPRMANGELPCAIASSL